MIAAPLTRAPQHVAGRGPHDPKGHLKTTQGIRVSDSQNQRNPGQYGTVLLEDLSCARRSLTSITSASSTRVALRRTAISNSTNPRRRSPSFISFSALTSGRRHSSPSTVAGGAGTVDTPCDVRLCRAILHEGGQLRSRQRQHPAFGHPKAIAATEGAKAPLDKAGVEGRGVTGLGPGTFIKAAGMRFRDREPKVRMLSLDGFSEPCWS